jgi:hypothetical protein
MTFTDAAREVLRQCGRPLHYKEITEIAIEKNLLSHVGKSPEVTMGARLAATLKKGGEENPLVRVKPGVFALREWDDDTIRQGLEIKRASKRAGDDDGEGDEDGNGVSATDDDNGAPVHAAVEADVDDEVETPAFTASAKIDGYNAPAFREEHNREADVAYDVAPASPDEEHRAELAAGATEVFAEEDDDDEPILRPLNDDEPQEQSEGRRRRRRRRRRGGRGGDDLPVVTTERAEPAAERNDRGNDRGDRGERGDRDRDRGERGGGTGGLPSYTAAPAYDDEAPSPRGPQVIELSADDVPALDGLAGRDLADAVAVILGTFDRTVGAVSLRQIAETALRRGKLTGEQQLMQSHIAAAVRADNARRTGAGLRPRFRMAGGRVGLTDWLLDGELARCERDLNAALNRFRDAARRAFVRKCGELPGHAFVELCMMILEKVGVSKLHAVKFPGASGSEAHFAGNLHVPASSLGRSNAAGDCIPLAIVLRKDGRDLGRERVTELRGAAHHYEGAQMGWIFTTGQVLSGAREEAGSTGVMPVALLDAVAMARLCEDHNIAVIRAENAVAIPDVDLFEGLRSS